MITIDQSLTPDYFIPAIDRFWELSAAKIQSILKHYDRRKGSPVFTAAGKYTTRGWTEWTQGFEFGSAILQYDATGDAYFLELGRKETVDKMASHVGHFGVHDHGFNNLSTYGNLLRLMRESRLPMNLWERHFYELAIKLSGAIQAHRWTTIPGGGYIYSFNGPHSLFVDTIRTVRILEVSHLFGHAIWDENDIRIDLLERAVQHVQATAKYAVFYGEGRDMYDVRGRVAHESVFNVNDGNYRCPNSQQGYSGFTTWTRGLAWAMLGFAEQLEFFSEVSVVTDGRAKEMEAIESTCDKAARAVCDFYLEHTPIDGIPYWDTGAPGLVQLGDYLNRPADPFNGYEPVDSSSAAIGAQGLLRLGHHLRNRDESASTRYWQGGLTILKRLLEEPYLSTHSEHQGLLLHSIYHRPNGWDYQPAGSAIPYGESSMWGDYHFRELVLYVQRIAQQGPYHSFFHALTNPNE